MSDSFRKMRGWEMSASFRALNPERQENPNQAMDLQALVNGEKMHKPPNPEP